MNAVVPCAHGWVARLRDFAHHPEEFRCEQCGAHIASDHPHLFDSTSCHLVCCCATCSLVFGSAQSGRYRAVPREGHYLNDFRMSDAQWDALAIPIGVVFFVHDSHARHMLAIYPGPAGATRSALDLAAWNGLVADNAVLEELQPDVEALLVNRANGAREYFRTPIDQCHTLTGLIRSRWMGVSGGAQAELAIRSFFASLKANGRVPEELRHA